MGLRESLAGGLARSILNSGFQEPITYTPQNKPSITINAVIDRSDPNPGKSNKGSASEGRPFPVNGVQFFIANDSSTGVATVKERFDTVKFPLREGWADVTFRVVKILEQDPGMWHLEATK